MGWLKSKCLKRQEFVIGGFTDPEGSRQGIGSMLVGYYDEDGRLVFAGKVGTGVGFTAKFCSDLRRRFERIEQKECPFAKRPPGWLGQHAHWLKPQLVAEIAFAEWTEGGNVRHGSFQGFREDKVARDVTREREMEVTSSASDADVVGSVQISHPERVIYPKLEFNKLDLANYYAEIAPWILPYVAGRPLTIVRCAEPIATENALREYCKFLPHTSGWHRFAGPNLRRVQIRELKKTGEYLVADSEAALVELAQGDIIEIHVWNSTFARLETPDRVVFDLDPAKGVPWKTLVHAALSLKDTLAELELESWVKTSGGKGLHVVVPFVPKLDWEQCFTASRAIAERLVAREPELFTLSFGKAARTSKILIDYKRNHRGAVAVAAYSARARPDGTVSVPVRWEDLKRLVPDKLTVSTVPKRVERLENDPWQGFWKSRQRLERALRALAK